MSFCQQNADGLLYYTSSVLAPVRHGFSTRRGGVSPAPWDTLNLDPGQGDAMENVLENHRRFAAVLGTIPERAVLSRQVHGAAVRIVTASDAGKGLFRERDYAADALITNEKGLPLIVFSADCGVLLLHDPVSGSIGAVHAGWRGCAAGIVRQTVEALGRAFGAAPRDLRAAIGPCIGPCCFETDGDVPEAMRAALGPNAEAYLRRQGAKWHVDLAGLNRQWLLDAGLAPENIDLSGLCTACHPDLFWSHRRQGSARGEQAAMILL